MNEGLKILLKTYWSSNGWIKPRWTEENFEIAKQEGYMFDYPEYMSHEDTLKELKTVVDKISPEIVAEAFLYSLSTRKLEYRSALGSYWYAVSVPYHEFDKEKHCYYCGWDPWKRMPDEYEYHEGLNVLNFERCKWGGVRHTNVKYALFDLKQFLKLPICKHTVDDEQILHNLLHCIDELEFQNKAGALQKEITRKKLLKSNKSEVAVLLNILGICGVLSSEAYPCYAVKFSSELERDPPEHTNDYEFPLNNWRVSDGVNAERYKRVFGKDYN